MSNLVVIKQGVLNEKGRQTLKTWSYWNTDLADETLLMKQAFLPIMNEMESLPNKEYKEFSDTSKTFFEKGTFISKAQFESLNRCLTILGYPTVSLNNNGEYYQPVATGKTSPDSTAWKQNAQARLQEFCEIIEQYKQGTLKIEKLGAKNIFEYTN